MFLMDKIIHLEARQIPQKNRDQAASYIKNYATVLLYDGNVIGSGTFVQCETYFGILTAHHVPQYVINPRDFKPNSKKKLGLVIHNSPHAFEIELQYISVHDIGIPKNEEYGPDLTFWEILDKNKLGTIKAFRSFWNILIEKSFIEKCYEDTNSLWAVCGLPSMWQRDETKNRKSKQKI